MSKQAGNFGCSIHNAAFRKMKLNFIYKSFSVEEGNLEQAVAGIRALGIRGTGVSMPYKTDILEYVDECSAEVSVIGAANTIVNDGGILRAHNTDCYASQVALEQYTNHDKIYILGNGGYSKAVQYSARRLFEIVEVITRQNWDNIADIKRGLVFNCTPVRDINVNRDVVFIDCLIDTRTGQELSLLQASKQFKLYTGLEFPFEYIRENFVQILENNNPNKER
jgi:shikimate 5-dehydrogenase